MATSSRRNSNKNSPSNGRDPLINFAPAKGKTKEQSNTRILRSNKEIKNLTSKDGNEETGDKNDDSNNNVVVPTDSELQLDSLYIPPVEKSLLDKLGTKRNNKKNNSNTVIEGQVQKNQKNTSNDVITIEDHQTDKMQSKRKYNSGNFGYDDSTTKLIRLDEKDASLLKKAIMYSQSAYDEALDAKEAAIEAKKAAIEAKEAAVRIESAIIEYLKGQTLQEKESEDSAKSNKKKSFWYTDTTIKACAKLFQLKKFPGDGDMSEYIHSALLEAYPDEIEKINNSKGGWANYWAAILQPLVRNELRIKRGGYVRNIKNAILNVFGRAYLGNFPGNKATAEDVVEWKSSPAVKQAKENLWYKVVEDGDDSDTYMNRITNEVLKNEDRTDENCAFIVTVVNLMLDPNVRTTTLSGELIRRKLKESANNNDECEPQYDDDIHALATSDDDEQ